MFISVMFPDTDDKIPFASTDELQKTLDSFLNNLEAVYKDSFQQFYFSNQNTPVLFHIVWLNGTKTEMSNIEITVDMFRHISSFDASTKFMLMVEDGSITGCTEWELVFKVRVALGSYLFYLDPLFERRSCSSDFVSNSDVAQTAFSYEQIISTRPAAVSEDKSNITSEQTLVRSIGFLSSLYNQHPSIRPHFNRKNLSFYYRLIKFGGFLLVVSFIDTVTICTSLSYAFFRHRQFMNTSPQYKDLETYEQFHSTIGFWQPIFLVTEIFVFITSIVLLVDSQSFTQYLPSQTILLFGFSAFLLISTTVRWFHNYPPCYCLVYIIRQAFVKLMLVVIGILPIVLSMVLIAIFLFGFVGQVAESMIKLVQLILCVTFGDIISDFYLSFTDGSYIYNTISFVFVTISTGFCMWLFFTSFTAQITSIYSDQVSSLIIEESEVSD